MKSLGFIWAVSGVRAHTVSLDVLKLWKECGCVSIGCGIESGSPTMLKIMEKKIMKTKSSGRTKKKEEMKIYLIYVTFGS